MQTGMPRLPSGSTETRPTCEKSRHSAVWWHKDNVGMETGAPSLTTGSAETKRAGKWAGQHFTSVQPGTREQACSGHHVLALQHSTYEWEHTS